MFTLWRNGTLLGRIDEPPADSQAALPGIVFGILRPTPAFAGMTSMTQVRHLFEPSKVTQHPMDPVQIGESLAPMEPIDPSDFLAGSSARTPPAQTVSDAEKLEVRSDDGTALDCSYISVVHCIAPDDFPVAEIRREWGTTGDERQFWMFNARVTEPLVG